MKEFLVQQIKQYLEEHESAPSACCLVHGVYYGDCDDLSANEIYDRSEGENDRDRDEMLDKLTDEQLFDLAGQCLEILL